MCNANLQLILDPDSMMDAMLSSKEKWAIIERHIIKIMKRKELTMRRYEQMLKANLPREVMSYDGFRAEDYTARGDMQVGFSG